MLISKQLFVINVNKYHQQNVKDVNISMQSAVGMLCFCMLTWMLAYEKPVGLFNWILVANTSLIHTHR